MRAVLVAAIVVAALVAPALAVSIDAYFSPMMVCVATALCCGAFTPPLVLTGVCDSVSGASSSCCRSWPRAASQADGDLVHRLQEHDRRCAGRAGIVQILLPVTLRLVWSFFVWRCVVRALLVASIVWRLTGRRFPTLVIFLGVFGGGGCSAAALCTVVLAFDGGVLSWCWVGFAGPLNAVVAAQAEAAMTTVKFINAGEHSDRARSAVAVLFGRVEHLVTVLVVSVALAQLASTRTARL